MPADVKEIYNRALTKIGHTELVTNVAATDKATVLCTLHYASCRDIVLRAAFWPFAKQQIALVIAAGVTRKGWEYVFTLPTDFLAARFLMCGETRVALTDPDNRYPYDIMQNTGGTAKVFCCDLSATEIDALEYTAKITDVTLYPEEFADALACRLAMELSLALPKSLKGYQIAQAAYREALLEAFATDLRSSRHEDQPLEGSGIRARS